jgi:NitT/TauT family transport system substrate-binding protein
MTALLLMMPAAMKAQGEHFVFTTAWKAQAQFAGYYVAYERGFYQKEGLDVEIHHPTLTCSALTRLKSQECDASMFSLMSAMDFISQGFPLVNIFQDSMNNSNMLISRWDTDPLKMKGKKVAIFNPDPNYLTYIMDHREGMHYEWIPFTSGINLFLSGAVDATMVVSYYCCPLKLFQVI